MQSITDRWKLCRGVKHKEGAEWTDRSEASESEEPTGVLGSEFGAELAPGTTDADDDHDEGEAAAAAAAAAVAAAEGISASHCWGSAE